MGASVKEKDKDGKGPTGKRKPGRICDKQVPCGKCVSRGCAAICPEDPPQPTTAFCARLVLANTEQLHERIEHLCTRIRELESALRGAQAQLSQEEHPLLRSDLLQLKSPHIAYPNERTTTPQFAPTSDTTTEGTMPPYESLIDAFGTLSIRENGEAQFLGQTARSEYLIRALAKPHKPSTSVLGTRLSQKIINGAQYCRDDSEHSFNGALTPSERDIHETGKEIFNLLPPLSEAIRLCEVYLEHGKYMYTPLLRMELFDEVLWNIYRSDSFDAVACHQTLALLFMVFALASLFDPELPTCSILAQEYFYLSKAALGFKPPYSHTTLKSIWCTVRSRCTILEFSDWEAMGSAASWMFVGHAVRMGSSMELDVDLNGSRWDLPEDILQRRYRLFWTVFTADTWSSFHYGRPPSLSRAYIDCPLPKDTEETINEKGERETGFHYWTWQFSAFMHTIMEETFGSSRPAYSTIIDFDRKIRDFPVPVNLRVRCPDVEPRRELYMQRLIVLSYKENTLMHLHRAYFAQALQDSSDDLTTHKYVASVIATFRSAWRLSQVMQVAWKNIPHLLARYHLAWSQVLSAAIVMCILVTRAPNSKMTKSSIEELDLIAHLFEEAAPTVKSAANILDTMRNLRRKAREAVDPPASSNGTSTTSASPAESSSSGSCEQFTNTLDVDETQELSLSTTELDRLGGRTHLIAECRTRAKTPGDYVGPSTHPSPDSHRTSPYLPTNGSLPTNGGNSPSNVNFVPSSFQESQSPQMQQQLFPAQNLHPTIALDIRNIEMNLGGAEFHFFDPPTDVRAEVDRTFGLGRLQPGNGSPQSQQGARASSSQYVEEMSSDSTLPHSHTDSAMSGMHFSDTPMAVEDMNLHMNFNAMGDMTDMGGLGAGMYGNNSMFSPPPSTAPILDATWQSFVEQLGF
ncbi:hypothetical protein BT96DRAFT_957908 [Gymnopus androsaceus JB14]|uniref:Xylanolytic transcriptional activator regulatory domain-containing protein n=1 Tax=Gymnopus androsaceus JB14 TaxID=1447944 RepID=A0A6A4HG33_9AGAR|nr:hypothetical protein BT96DRAFT_957908 [Gymnopus androsaceus JB14]